MPQSLPSPDQVWLGHDLARVGLTPTNKGADGEAEFVRIRHGAHAPKRAWEQLDDRGRYLARLHATSAMLLNEPVLSHYSAAAVWNLVILGKWPRELHQVVPGDNSRSTPHIVRHRRTDPGPVVRKGSFLITGAARTVTDLASLTPFASGVLAADRALATGLVTPAELEDEALARAGRRGVRLVRAVVAAADGRSESPGESLSRARMVQARLPVPTLQQEFHDAEGLIGRCDFYWKEYQLVGEFDGRMKYGRAFAELDSPEERLWREKVREDRLRALGLGVARWVWSDALRGRPLVRILAGHGLHPLRTRARFES